jgi:hypothetical protein
MHMLTANMLTVRQTLAGFDVPQPRSWLGSRLLLLLLLSTQHHRMSKQAH